MITLRRILLASAAVAAALVQGCGCSDSKKKNYSPPPQQPPQTYTVTGAASKGILRNFQVAAHRFNNGTLDPTPVASSSTNNAGAYSLSIPQAYANQPLLFRVTPYATGSVMTCDLSAGCGPEVNFGDDLPVTGNDFVLDSVVSASANSSIANITLLSHLAAQLAQAAIQNGASAADIQAAINQANSSIANRFGLVGNITTMPVIDLTNVAAVRAALNAGNASYIHYASINAAIVQAALQSNNLLNFTGALNAFTTYYTNGGIAGNTTSATETSLASVLAAARAILGRVQSRDPEAPQALVTLLQNLLVEQQLAESEEPDVRSPGTPSTGAGATDLQKAKNMVADLRDFAASIGGASLGDDLSIAGVSEQFAMQIEAAEMAGGEQAGYLVEALAMVGKAIDDAYAAHQNNSALQSHTGAYGIVVAISSENNTTIFTVNRDVNVPTDTGYVPVAVSVTARNSLSMSEGGAGGQSTETLGGMYAVSGSAASAQMALTIKPGSSISITGLEQTEAGTDTTRSLDAMTLNLSVSLAQVLPQNSDPLTVDGSITVSLVDALLEDDETPNSGTRELTLSQLSLNFSGKVSNTTGESFAFSLSIAGNADGVSFVESWGAQGGSTSGETAEEFVGVSASLAFTAQLTGIPSVVTVVYNLERTGLESGTNSLVVRYPGKLFRFAMAVEDGEPLNPLTIINHDGAVMTLNENTVNGRSTLDGNIKVNGVTHATIEERQTIIITFSDESVVSL